MRVKWLIVTFCIILAWLGCSFSKGFFQGDFLSSAAAQKKWGKKAFDAKKFIAASEADRKAMAVGLLMNPKYVGKDMWEVQKDLGVPNSYFFSDTIYAYKLTEKQKKNADFWHLVFIPDRSLKKVKEIKIHKKCCYKRPFLNPNNL